VSSSEDRSSIPGQASRHDAWIAAERQAESDLCEAIRRGEYCCVLASSERGKLARVRVAARLREEGITIVVLDVAALLQARTAEHWYDILLDSLRQQLDLGPELDEFRKEHHRLGPLQRWMAAVREVALPGIGVQAFRSSGVQEGAAVPPEDLNTRTPEQPSQLVIFLDEIDAVRNLPFSTDEFFAAIRECYNRRTQDPELNRLTFCLIGAARLSDIIQDVRTTSFNIGRRFELTEFSEVETVPPRTTRRKKNPVAKLLKYAIDWICGEPYFCRAHGSVISCQ
jgi:hypothetical protein